MHEGLSAAPPTVRREFTFPGEAASIVPAREAIMGVIREHTSSEAEEIDVFLAVQEALANAVQHGCRTGAGKEIYCSVQIDPSAFTIVVRDSGDGFDAGSATREREAGINTTEHGRGIGLMRSLMDEVSYHGGGSEVRMRKLRTGDSTLPVSQFRNTVK